LYASFILLNMAVVEGWKMRWIADCCVRSILEKPEGKYVGVTKIMKMCSKEIRHDEWVGTAQSVHRLATVWTVRGSNRIVGEIFPHPSRPAHSVFHTRGTASSPGLKRPGRDVNHPHPSSAQVK